MNFRQLLRSQLSTKMNITTIIESGFQMNIKYKNLGQVYQFKSENQENGNYVTTMLIINSFLHTFLHLYQQAGFLCQLLGRLVHADNRVIF